MAKKEDYTIDLCGGIFVVKHLELVMHQLKEGKNVHILNCSDAISLLGVYDYVDEHEYR